MLPAATVRGPEDVAGIGVVGCAAATGFEPALSAGFAGAASAGFAGAASAGFDGDASAGFAGAPSVGLSYCDTAAPISVRRKTSWFAAAAGGGASSDAAGCVTPIAGVLGRGRADCAAAGAA